MIQKGILWCQGLDGLAAQMGLGTRLDTTLSRSKRGCKVTEEVGLNCWEGETHDLILSNIVGRFTLQELAPCYNRGAHQQEHIQKEEGAHFRKRGLVKRMALTGTPGFIVS